jgi:hypothetical protein
VLPIIDQLRDEGAETLTAIAAELARMGVPTPSGQGRWHAATVARGHRRRANLPDVGRSIAV